MSNTRITVLKWNNHYVRLVKYQREVAFSNNDFATII